MKLWVKFENGLITEGPISMEEQPNGFVEYVEVIQLPSSYKTVNVSVALVEGKCIKTVTADVSYSIQRQKAYPSPGDQLDMLWHAMNAGVLPKVEPFFSDVANIKAQYPKPTA